MNVIPLKVLESTLDDVIVFELVASHPEVKLTESVIRALEQWFVNVEIDYPIAEIVTDTGSATLDGGSDDEFAAVVAGLDKKAGNRRELVLEVVADIKKVVERAVGMARAEKFDEDAAEAWSTEIDNLWRELARSLAPELNAFFRERIGEAAKLSKAERAAEIKRSIEAVGGQEALDVFRQAAKSDPHVRTSLRRQGVDPDLL